jgi:RecA/RadA recombinase
MRKHIAFNKCPNVSALELYKKSRKSLISTGNHVLDTLTNGGLRYGEVVELYGGISSGKTQVKLKLNKRRSCR